MAKTILLADDSVTIQKVVELTFMDQDYQVVAVGDGTSALARLPELRPDLVIADVHMPGANGYQVCRQTKATHPDIPVLLLVGTFEQFDEAEATAAGADSFLKKPFDSQDLLRQVEALIAAKGGPEEEPFPEMATSPALSPFDTASAFHVTESEDLEPPSLEPLSFAPPSPASPSYATPASAAPSFEPEPMELEPMELEPVELEPMELEPAELDEDLEPPELTAEVRTAAVPTAPASDTRPTAARPIAAPPPAPAPAPPAAAPAATAENGHVSLSDEDVERIARRVVELVGEKTVREVAWEVVPDMAEVVIRERIRELESQVE